MHQASGMFQADLEVTADPKHASKQFIADNCPSRFHLYDVKEALHATDPQVVKALTDVDCMTFGFPCSPYSSNTPSKIRKQGWRHNIQF